MPDPPRRWSSPIAPHTSTPQELQERLSVERAGEPHLIFRDAEGRQVIRRLGRESGSVTIGRRPDCDVSLPWDEEVSRVHAQLELVGQEWTIVDDGLSRNGSFIFEERLLGRRRLRHDDQLMVGNTSILVRVPAPETGFTTRPGGRAALTPSLSEDDRKVLVALCRPLKDQSHAVPATNKAIAEELNLSVPAVKKRLAALFVRFDLADASQGEKRTRLAVEAFQRGIVRPRDL